VTLLLQILGALLLAMGTGLVCLALLRMEQKEDLGRLSKGWRRGQR